MLSETESELERTRDGGGIERERRMEESERGEIGEMGETVREIERLDRRDLEEVVEREIGRDRERSRDEGDSVRERSMERL